MFNIIGESCFQIQNFATSQRERERKRGNKIYADGPRTFEVNNYKLVNVHPLLLPKSVVTKFG